MRDIYSKQKYKIKLINHYPYGDLEEKYVVDALHKEQLAQGEYVKLFEKKLAKYLHINPELVVATSTGTAALHMAVELEYPKEVAVEVPAITFTATSDAIKYAGLAPWYIDIDSNTWNAHIKDGIGVDLFGVPCDPDPPIMDACESLGAELDNKKCGTLCKYNCLSFFANKPITTGGEGGTLIVPNDKDAESARRMRSHGRLFGDKYHSWPAFGYRMTEIQAAFGVAQMELLDDMIKAKRIIHNTYLDELGDSVTFQQYMPQSKPSWYFNCVKFKSEHLKNKIQKVMRRKDIECREVFPPPIYHTPSWNEPCPNAEELYKRGLILPSGPLLSIEHIKKISKIILENI